MDKYEYKVRVDEIKSLISEGEYAQAVKIADTIDWRRVKSVMMLCTISDLYKINRRYEDSKNILLLAYERHTGGRLIVYSLCELSIKLGEYVQALEYYKEFVQLAPKDSGRYILQYKLYEAQEVSLEERIEVLEELKKRDYREKWAYELAYLYHRVGLTSKCVEECDEMFLWFGEGRYVLKALELKMLHAPLDEEQQLKYEQMKQTGGFVAPDYVAEGQAMQEEASRETEEEDESEFSLEENMLTNSTQEMPEKEELDIQVKTVDVSQYNTLNLQKELAESMKEFLEENKTQDAAEGETNRLQKTKVYEPVTGLDSRVYPDEREPSPMPRQDVNGEKAESRQGVSGARPEAPSRQSPDGTGRMAGGGRGQSKNTINMDAAPTETGAGNVGSEEVFFGNTEEVNIQDVISELAGQNGSSTLFEPVREQIQMPGEPGSANQEQKNSTPIAETSPDPALSNTGVIKTFHKKSGYDDMLTQDYDGQISLVVPEQAKVEKQITGQLSIEDIMAEWEKMKQESERRRMDEIRKRVHQQTDTLFADFDESTKSGLLEELEKAMVNAAIKEEKLKAAQERPKEVKVADLNKKETVQQPLEDTAHTEVKGRQPSKKKERKPEPIIEEEQPETEPIQERGSWDALEKEEVKTQEAGTEEAKAQEEDEDRLQDDREVDAEGEDTTDTAEEIEEVGDRPPEEEDEKEGRQGRYPTREMNASEREMFAPFIHHKRTRRQIVEAIDNISMASYTGNVIITGEEGTGTIALAKLLMKEVQLSDSNFSGKVAKISGATMNKKDVSATLSKLSGGALIVEGACSMKKAAVEQLLKALNQEEKGLIVLLEDAKGRMDDFLAKYPRIKDNFNLRVDVEALDDQTLVKYARKYALDQEYSIDELGVLALHTRIADMQTSDHEVTLGEIEELVDEAIYYADKKTPKHFFDVLLGKRYDEEDMIVLREKDFMHY